MVKKNSRLFGLAFLLTVCTFAFSSPKTASEYYSQGVEFQLSGQYFPALESFQQSVLINPIYGDAWLHLAQCSYYLDKYEMALHYAENAEKYALENAEIQNLKGMTYIALGNLENARAIFEDVLKKYPNNVESRFGLAELNLFAGRLGDAEILYKDALKRHGTNRKALLSLALLAEEQGKSDLARSYIEQALAWHSDNAEVHYLAACLLCQEKKFEEAEYKVRAALQLDNEYYDAYELLANILYLEKKYTEALDVCDFFIDSRPSESHIWYLKGLCLQRLGREKEAIDVWENGLSENPYDELMRSALELLAEKIVPLEDERRSDWAAFHIEKARAYEKNFQGSAMRFEYQRALKLSPFNIEARKSYSQQLLRDGLHELYLDQLKFIKNSLENSGEKPNVELTDTIEAYDSLLKNTLASKWNINAFMLEKKRWKLGIYYMDGNAGRRYPDSQQVVSDMFCSLFSGLSAASVDAGSFKAADFAQAFANARFSGIDYFIVLSLEETSRELVLNARVCSASTGNEVASFSIFRTGNDRYSISLRLLRQKILEILPVRGKILARNGDVLLVDLGRSEGVTENFEFDVVKKGGIKTADIGPGVTYRENSVIGKAVVTRADGDVSEVRFVQKGFFDRLNIGDEIVLSKVPDNSPSEKENSEISSENAPSANADGKSAVKNNEEENPLSMEELGLSKTPALIELIRNIRNAD